MPITDVRPRMNLELFLVDLHRFSLVVSINVVLKRTYPTYIVHKSIAGRYQPIRVADGPITVRYRFM